MLALGVPTTDALLIGAIRDRIQPEVNAPKGKHRRPPRSVCDPEETIQRRRARPGCGTTSASKPAIEDSTVSSAPMTKGGKLLLGAATLWPVLYRPPA